MAKKVARPPSVISASFCHSRPSFCHSRESGNPSSHGKAGVWQTPTDGWIPVCTGMTERDPQHGKESCPPSLCHSRILLSFLPLLLSFPRKRESIFTWQGGCLADTNRRMDSRLHGNDGKRPPTWQRKLPALPLSFPHPSVIPAPPSVIPAKAGIHLHMARRVSGRHQQTDGFSDGFPFARE